MAIEKGQYAIEVVVDAADGKKQITDVETFYGKSAGRTQADAEKLGKAISSTHAKTAKQQKKAFKSATAILQKEYKKQQKAQEGNLKGGVQAHNRYLAQIERLEKVHTDKMKALRSETTMGRAKQRFKQGDQDAGGGMMGKVAGLGKAAGPVGMAVAGAFAAIGGGIMAATKKADQFNSSLAQLKVTLGDDVSSDQFKVISEQLASLPIPAHLAREELGRMAASIAGIAPPDQIVELVEQMANLSKMEPDTDMNKITASVGRLGKSIGDTGLAMDIIAQTSVNLRGKAIDPLDESLTELGTIFSKANIVIKDTEKAILDSAVAFSAMSETGFEIAEATTAVEEIYLKLNDFANDTVMQEKLFAKFPEGFDTLKEKIKGGEIGAVEFIDQLQSMGSAADAVAYEIGSTAGEGIQTLITNLNQSGRSMADFSSKFDNVTGAAKRFAEEGTTPAQAAAAKLSASWDSMMISVGQGTTGFMSTMKSWTADAVGWFGDLFKSTETMAIEARGKAEESMSTFTEMGGVISTVMNDIQSGDISDGTVDQLRAQLEVVRDISPFAAREMEKLMNQPGGLTQEGLARINELLTETEGKMGVIAIGDQLDASQAGLEAGKDSIEGILDVMSDAARDQVGFWENVANVYWPFTDGLNSMAAQHTEIGTAMQDQVEAAEFLGARHAEMKTALDDENLSVKERRVLLRDVSKLETDMIKNDGAKQKLSNQFEKDLKREFKDKKAIAKIRKEDFNVQQAMLDVGQELIAHYEAEGATLEEIERLARDLYDTTGAQEEAEANINDYLIRQNINETSTNEQRLEALQTKKGLLDAEIAGLKVAQEAYTIQAQTAALEAKMLAAQTTGDLASGAITPEQAAAQRQQVTLLEEAGRLGRENADTIAAGVVVMELESDLLDKQIQDLGGIKESQAELVEKEQESVDLAKEKADLLSAESAQAMKLLNHRKAMGDFDGKEGDFLREKSKILADQEQALVDQGAAEEDIWAVQEKRHKAEKDILDLKKEQTKETVSQAQAGGGGTGAGSGGNRTKQEQATKGLNQAYRSATQSAIDATADIAGLEGEIQQEAGKQMGFLKGTLDESRDYTGFIQDMAGKGFEIAQILASSGMDAFMQKVAEKEGEYIGMLGKSLKDVFQEAQTGGQLDELELLFRNMGDHGERIMVSLGKAGSTGVEAAKIVLEYYKKAAGNASSLAASLAGIKDKSPFLDEAGKVDDEAFKSAIEQMKEAGKTHTEFEQNVAKIKSTYVGLIGEQAEAEIAAAVEKMTLQEKIQELRDQEAAALETLVKMESVDRLNAAADLNVKLTEAKALQADYLLISQELMGLQEGILSLDKVGEGGQQEAKQRLERVVQHMEVLKARPFETYRQDIIEAEIAALQKMGLTLKDIGQFTQAYNSEVTETHNQAKAWLGAVGSGAERIKTLQNNIADSGTAVAKIYKDQTAEIEKQADIGEANLIENERMRKQDPDEQDGRNFAAEKERIESLHELQRMTDEERLVGLRWILKAQLAELEALDKAGEFQGTNLEYMNARMKIEKEMAALGKGEAAEETDDKQDTIDGLQGVADAVNTINELWDIGKDLIEASETGGWALAQAFGEAGQGVADMAGELTGLPLGEVYGAVAGLVDRVFNGVLDWEKSHDSVRMALESQTELYLEQIVIVNDLLDVEQERLKTQQLFNDILVGGVDEAGEQWHDLSINASSILSNLNVTAGALGKSLGDLGLTFDKNTNLENVDKLREGYQDLTRESREMTSQADEWYAIAADKSLSKEVRDNANEQANSLMAQAEIVDSLIGQYGEYIGVLSQLAAAQRAFITDDQDALEHRKAMGEFEGDELGYYQEKVTNAQSLLDLATEQYGNGLITIQQLWDIQEAAKAANDEQAEFMTSQGAGPDFAARKQNLKLMLDLEKLTEDQYRERMLTLLNEQLGYVDSIADSYATQLDYANARMEIELEIAGLMAGQNDMSDEAIAKLSELNRQRQEMILAGRTGADVDPAAVAAIEDQIISTMTDAGATQEAIQAAIAGFSMASYDKGTPYVSEDQVARIHAGERILTSTENQDLVAAVQGLASDQYLTSLVSLFKSQIESGRGMGYAGGGGDSIFAPTINAYGSDPEETTDMMMGALQEAHSDWHEQEGTGNNR